MIELTESELQFISGGITTDDCMVQFENNNNSYLINALGTIFVTMPACAAINIIEMGTYIALASATSAVLCGSFGIYIGTGVTTRILGGLTGSIAGGLIGASLGGEVVKRGF